MISTNNVSTPVRAVGNFFAMALDALFLMQRRPFAWRGLLLQTWFVARVSILPTLMLSIPFTVLTVFTVNVLLVQFGAADYSGTGAALTAVTQIGPVVTVLVVFGAGATAMCADLGARTIREELDALRVMGINPIHALVVPRVLAATVVALALSSSVTLVGSCPEFGGNREHGRRFRFTTCRSAKKEELRPCLFEYQPPTVSAPRWMPCLPRIGSCWRSLKKPLAWWPNC